VDVSDVLGLGVGVLGQEGVRVLGRGMDAYVGYRKGVGLLLGMWAYHGRAEPGTGIVGVFDVEKRVLTDVLPLGRFPGVVGRRKCSTRGTTTSSRP
jgi:hypothetical protein